MSGPSAGMIVWKTAFELTPIILVNGLANFMPVSMLPIAALTEVINLPQGILGGTETSSLDDFFAHFKPLPGSTIIDQDLGRFPYANITVAANAVIVNPNVISLQMTCPAHGSLGMFLKLGIMQALQFALRQHNISGGTYHVATPSHIYFDCVMRSMRDVSPPDGTQPQQIWQIDFEQPLLTLGDAQQAQNQLFQLITNGSKLLNPAWSGLATSVGQAISAQAGSVVPSAGAAIAGTLTPAASPITVSPLPPQ